MKYGLIQFEMAPFGLKLGRIEACGLNNMFIRLPTPFRVEILFKNCPKNGKFGKHAWGRNSGIRNLYIPGVGSLGAALLLPSLGTTLYRYGPSVRPQIAFWGGLGDPWKLFLAPWGS